MSWLDIHQKPGKRCVFVMREKCNELARAKRTLTFVSKNKNQADVGKLTGQLIKKDIAICTDESNAYVTYYMPTMMLGTLFIKRSAWLMMARPII